MAKKKEKKAGKRMKKKELANILMDFFHTKQEEVISLKYLFAELHLTTHPLKMLCMDILADMLADDYITEVDKNKYKLNNHGIEMTGTFQRKSNGKNSFIPEGGGEPIFIAERNSAHAMNNDKVKIAFFAKRKHHDAEGEVIEILERANDTFVGTLEVEKSYAFLVTENRTLANDIFIPKDKLKGGKTGDKAVVKVIEWPDKAKNPIGQVIDILGKAGDNTTEMHAILAEFGLPYVYPQAVEKAADKIPAELLTALKSDATPEVRRAQVAALRQQLNDVAEAHELLRDADALVEKSIWLIGGDGWAYDIGFGGLDHVLSLTENVNILVLDTQCYSNTGGQASKATPLGAVTKFGEHGKRKARKDLGVSMMMYGHVYVAQISLGAQLNQTVKAIQEAEAYPGPSLIIAYSPCEEHGYDLALSHDQMRQLTATGFWPLYRFDPRRADEGKLPLALDSRPPSEALEETLLHEQRFRRLNSQQPEVAEQLWKDAAADLQKRYDFLAQMAGKAEKSNTD